MATYTVTIGGVDHTTDVRQEDTIRITRARNNRSTATLTIRPGYLPAKRAPIVITKDGTAIFSGVVLKRQVMGLKPGTQSYFTILACADMLTYADWCYQTKTYASAVTLKTVLQDFVTDKLAAHGISLHASQVDGPTFAPFSMNGKRVSDGLREACGKAEYDLTMSPAGVLRAVVPGTDAALVAITDAGPNCTDLSWADTDEIPANLVTLVCGPTGTGTPTQTWTANGVATSWVVDIQAVVGGWTQGYVYDGTANRTVSASGGGGYYYWDDTAGLGTISVGTGATPGAGVVLTFVYTAQYPFTVTATASVSPAIEYSAAIADVLTVAAAQEIADATLARLNQDPRDFTIPTHVDGFEPSQALTINSTYRSFVGTAIITSVSIALVSGTWTDYIVKATESATPTRAPIDKWREMTSGGSSTSLVVVSGGGSSSAPSSPFPLGGSRSQPLELGTAAWFAAPEYQRFEAPVTGTVKVMVDLWAMEAGVSCTARLYCLTDSAPLAPTSSAVTSTTPTATSFTVAVEAGKDYCLQLLASTNAKAVFGMATGRYL
jgi:hypothetical protein